MVEICDNFDRVEYLKEEYDISTNCAKALLLTEMGMSHSSIAQLLSVNPSTVKGYLSTLESEIGEYVTETVPKSQRYNTFPSDNRSVKVTPNLDENIFPHNKGVNLKDIDPEIMSA